MLPFQILLAFLVAANPNADSLETQLRQEYVGAPRILRHFYVADKLKFDAAGEPLNHEPAVSWTLAAALVIEKRGWS
jgi:hypothetical protein